MPERRCIALLAMRLYAEYVRFQLQRGIEIVPYGYLSTRKKLEWEDIAEKILLHEGKG